MEAQNFGPLLCIAVSIFIIVGVMVIVIVAVHAKID